MTSMENYFLSLSFCLIDKYSLTSYAKAVIKHAWNEQLGRQFVFALGFGLLFHFLLPSSLQHDKSLTAVTPQSQHSPCSICTEAVPRPRAVTGSHEGVTRTVKLNAEPQAHRRTRQGLLWTKRDGGTPLRGSHQQPLAIVSAMRKTTGLPSMTYEDRCVELGLKKMPSACTEGRNVWIEYY